MRLYSKAFPVSCAIATVLCASALAGALPDKTPHILVENFRRAITGEGNLHAQTISEDAAVGESCAEFSCSWGENRSYHTEFRFADMRPILATTPGTIKYWIRGDSSGNHLQIIIWHGRQWTDDRGEQRWGDTREYSLETVVLDFDGWREFSCHIDPPPSGHKLFWRAIRLHPRGEAESKFALDDMRFYPDKDAPKAVFDMDAGQVGQTIRGWIDLRNFTDEDATCRLRMSIVDANENPVGSIDSEIALEKKSSLCRDIEIVPDDLTPFTPPFRVQGDILSPEIPSAAARIDHPVVFVNAHTAFDLFADVFGTWGSRDCDAANELWRVTESEAYRFSPFAAPNVSFRRVQIDQSVPNAPKAPYAMRVETHGPGAIFNYRPMAERYLPGDSVSVGFWIHGDGSGMPLYAILHDFSDMADYWSGGWKRIHAEPQLCNLDFTDWRYIEIDLPGNGLLRHTPKGSTPDIDSPLELAGFRIGRIKPPKGKDNQQEETPEAISTAVEFGPIFVRTQQPSAEAQALFLGASDPELFWSDDTSAFAIVQNGAIEDAREFRLTWTFRDVAGQNLANGIEELTLAAAEIRTIDFDLSECAKRIADGKCEGPFSLKATLAPVADASAAVSRELVFAKPNAIHIQGDFEDDDGTLMLVAHDTPKEIAEEALRPHRVASNAHSGLGALSIPWSTNLPASFATIAPDMPGEAVKVSLWVHGDGSGARFVPAVADKIGISKGINYGSWDFLNLRGENGTPATVTVDWKGWRKLEFLVQPIPGNRDSAITIESFVPSYPLGLHLGVLPPSTTNGATEGELLFDDVIVETHIPSDKRIGIAFAEPAAENLRAPGAPVAIHVWNDDAVARSVKLAGGIYDWRGKRVDGREGSIDVPPHSKVDFTIVEALPQGVFQARAWIVGEDPSTRVSPLVRDLVCADPQELIGENWHEMLLDPWKLRGPVGCRFEIVDDEWDWAEYHPGNYQDVSSRKRIQTVANRAGDPWLLLGYCAYWAAGEGYEGIKAGAFNRRGRDIGHGVDVFMTPERIEDWDSYVRDRIRNLSPEVDGWVLWNSPDAPGPLHVEEKRMAEMLDRIAYWQDFYKSEAPLILGGITPETGVGYLESLCASNALGAVSGVQLRLDPGRSSPEDNRLIAQAAAIRDAMGTNSLGIARKIIAPELDWAVEHDAPGSLDVMEQAAYLARVALLFGAEGYRTEPNLFNSEFDRVGFGLLYRMPRLCTPMEVKMPVQQLKPSWVALARLHSLLPSLRPAAVVDLADTRNGRTHCHVFFDQSSTDVRAAIWRTDSCAWLDFGPSGIEPANAIDLLGAKALRDDAGRYAIGQLPMLFTFSSQDAAATAKAIAMSRIAEEDGTQHWMQRILAQCDSDSVDAEGGVATHPQDDAEAAISTHKGLDWLGNPVSAAVREFAAGESETFEVPVEDGAGIVLRQQWWLGDAVEGAAAPLVDIAVDGASVATLDLSRTDPALSSGLRGSFAVIPADKLAGRKSVKVTASYPNGGNSLKWDAFAWRTGEELPLGSLAPIHADQPVESMRIDRNVIGGPVQIDTEKFEYGIGVFAPSLVEYALDGKACHFLAKVGIDAATEGKGSVIFEVALDGNKVWDSGLVSGLDSAKEVDIEIPAGTKRLRLTVTDGGDGNRFDAADWAEARIIFR